MTIYNTLFSIKKIGLLILYGSFSAGLHFFFALSIELSLAMALIPVTVSIYFFFDEKFILLSLVSGNLIFFSFPDQDYFFLIYIAFIPLFYMIQKVESYKSLFYYGALTGIVTLVGGFYWVNDTISVFGYLPQWISVPLFMLFTIAFSLKFPLFMIALRWVEQNIAVSRLITYPLVITLADFLVYELFPWYFGNTQYKNIYLIQIVEVTGVIGVTLFIVFFNTLIYELIQSFKEKQIIPYNKIAIGCFIVVTIYLFGYLRYGIVQQAMSKATPITVGIVQPNTPVGGYKNYFKIYQIISRLSYQLAKKQIAKKQKIDLLVWPESAAPFSYSGNGSRSNLFKKLVDDLATEFNMHIFFGDFDSRIDSLGHQQVYNNCNLVSPELKLLGQYHKIYLLPFGEYMPFGDLFPSLYDIFKHLGGGMVKGKTIKIFNYPKAKLAPQICYEILLPAFTRKFIDKGATVIINITNDRWFGNTKASKQHLVVGLFRAIENRVPIVRATNSGISTFVNALGEIDSEETPLYKKATTVHTIRPPKEIRTFYTKVGDLFAYFLMGFMLLLIIFKRKVDVM